MWFIQFSIDPLTSYRAMKIEKMPPFIFITSPTLCFCLQEKVCHSLLVSLFGLCSGIATSPPVGPCRGHGAEMGMWSIRFYKPETRQTWDSRGTGRCDTPSKRRSARNDKGVSLIPSNISSVIPLVLACSTRSHLCAYSSDL